MIQTYNTSYTDCLQKVYELNKHPKLIPIFDKLPSDVQQFKNMIFYGPRGIGKYSQMLFAIHRYSPSHLKYDKKATLTFDKIQYSFKISDIHYEIDMNQLGTNPKQLWNEIFLLITDIISTKAYQCGIIVCKNFHETNQELLDVFYSYMKNEKLKFILLTEAHSFLNINIINACVTLHIPKPTKTIMSKIHRYENSSIEIITEHISICDNILQIISFSPTTSFDFMHFRETIYNILIYNLNIFNCIEYILQKLIQEELIVDGNIIEVMHKTETFFKKFNNNFRPIFHLENYFLFLIETIRPAVDVAI
jgi:hypothetical protein